LATSCAIEDRTVRRVGGIRDRKIDVRILAATNRDLQKDVQGERFRKDLYFRLAVILLRLPPLRERADDVLILAEHFLKQYAAKYGRDVRRISAEAAALLRAYPWPGNVRELSHVMERAILWSHEAELGAEHLSLNNPDEFMQPADGNAPAVVPGLPPDGMDLGQWERAMLEQALQQSGGNQTRAAQRLGISRDTLRYRLKKYGIGG
jgi:DNA-binding NtrC family response regulator